MENSVLCVSLAIGLFLVFFFGILSLELSQFSPNLIKAEESSKYSRGALPPNPQETY